MYKQEEHFFTTSLNYKIFYQKWTPTANSALDPEPNSSSKPIPGSSKTKKVLMITHGQGEHCGAYNRVIEALKDSSYIIYAWDLVGHGRSEGKRGFISDFQHHIQNFLDMMTYIQQTEKCKISLLSHSMGGMIQLASVTQPDFTFDNIDKLIFSAPFLDVAKPVPLYKDLAAIVIGRLFPKITLPDGLENSMITQDPIVQLEYNKDVYRHHWMSSPTYLGVIKESLRVRNEKHKFPVPTYFQLPEDDPVVSTPVTKKFIESLNDKNVSFHIYENRKHEIYNDLRREEPLTDLKNFLMT